MNVARSHLVAQPPGLAKAAEQYEVVCEGGYMPACSALANLYQDGRGVPHDPARARTLHQRACDGGAGIGCFNLALMLQGGVWVDADAEAAGELFLRADAAYETACAAGELAWCMNRGVLYEDGFGVPQDHAKARAIYTDACSKGHADSCVNGALMDYYGKGVVPDKTGPKDRIAAHCSDATPLACGVLGQMYLVEGDARKAIPLLEQACTLAERDACGVLGAAYGMGEVVAADAMRASLLEERACLLGSSMACFVEAQTARDDTRAALFHQRACTIGHAEACGMYGAHLELGKGVPADPAQSLAMYRVACQMGDPGSCVGLLQKGQELPLSTEEAARFRQAACANGVQEACP